jgi:hypothetical protein
MLYNLTSGLEEIDLTTWQQRLIPNPGVYLEYETITHNPTPVG